MVDLEGYVKYILPESIINNLAIPAFFFEPVKTESGAVVNFIVDGQQRLTTLLDYYDGKFNLLPLGDVPYISPNSGHYAERPFNQLPQGYQNAFEGYRLTVIKLRDLGDQRLEVFRRINQGGTPLSGQDIRLAYYGEKSKSISFIRLTGLMTLELPTTKAVLANARSRWNIEHPWKDADAFKKWREFWKEPRGPTRASSRTPTARRCGSAPVLMALRDAVGIERVVVDTYQSVSGTGADAIAKARGPGSRPRRR